MFKLANEPESSVSLGLTKFQRREATRALATSQDGILGHITPIIWTGFPNSLPLAFDTLILTGNTHYES